MRVNRFDLFGWDGLAAAIVHQAYQDATSNGTSEAAQQLRDEARQWFADGGHLEILDALGISIHGGNMGGGAAAGD